VKRLVRLLILCLLCLASPILASPVLAEARWVATPYAPPRVMFELYLDHPQKIGGALYWIRALMNTLQGDPYNYSPEDMKLVVVIHGTEIVTVAKKNEASYREAVERMRYYADLGVKFRVCGQAAEDFGYAVKDFQDFVEVVPNAITELAHWQQQGYALIVPQVLDKQVDIDAIR
jgi:intracellular sulfur oxidation DsrE/DsrF family protein